MRSSHVHIESPCHESWEAMEGGSERRFCGVCEKHVHNLSAMRHDDALALLRDAAGEHLCVRYTAEADGSLRFRDLVPAARLTRGLRGIRRAAFAAVLLAACGPQIEVPVPEIHDVIDDRLADPIVDPIVDAIAYATEATADGGCKFTTGPFTTFHFPAGHAFCGAVDHAASVGSGSPPADPLAGEVDPHPRPKMGEAIADPGPVDPFVPCEPEVRPFAPPPPSSEPPPRGAPPRELMGDVAMPVPEPPIQGGLRVPEPPPPVAPVIAPLPDPFPGSTGAPPAPEPGFAPPPNPFPGSGFAPPPNPSPGSGYTPPPGPPERPLMGSISAPVVERMGRRAAR